MIILFLIKDPEIKMAHGPRAGASHVLAQLAV